MALLSLVKQHHYHPNSTLYLLYTFFFITIFYVLKKLTTTRTNKNSYNLPPSPPKLPFIGNLHQLGTLPHRTLAALSKKYGPLMLLHLGKTPTLVVSSADVAREISKTHDVAFSNRPRTKAASMFFYGDNDVGFIPYGEGWRQIRKIQVHDFLSLNKVRSFQPMREKEVGILVDTIREACAVEGSCVDLSELLVATANNIGCRSLLGASYEAFIGSRSFGELGRKLMAQLGAFSFGDFFPSLGWLDALTGLTSELNSTFAALDDFLEEVIEYHKRRRNNLVKAEEDSYENDENFVDKLLRHQENGGLVLELTHLHLKGLLSDLFVGVGDTTSTTLEWAFAELVRNPKIMKKVQEEVRKIVGQKSKIEENDTNQMTYLKCVIKETFRLHPPSPILLPRETTSDVKINGYNVPPKTLVYVNAWAIQRDPKIWDNPDEFIPERFENSHIDIKGQDFQLIPFGSGRRGCPGATYASASIENVLANLLYWFDWKMPKSGVPMEGIDMSEMKGLIVNKKVPLHLKPIPYSAGSKA